MKRVHTIVVQMSAAVLLIAKPALRKTKHNKKKLALSPEVGEYFSDLSLAIMMIMLEWSRLYATRCSLPWEPLTFYTYNTTLMPFLEPAATFIQPQVGIYSSHSNPLGRDEGIADYL